MLYLVHLRALKSVEFSLHPAMHQLGMKEVNMGTLVSTLLEIEHLGPVHVRGYIVSLSRVLTDSVPCRPLM
jgi:hypothetical protein